MKTLAIFLFIAIAFAHSTSFSAEFCLKENASIQWQGKIHRTTFPGPPNYENIKKGDKPETYWILEIPTPVCIENEKSLSKFQLIIDPIIYKNKNLLLKEKVKVEGSLTPQITGHHHTPFLIDVKSIT